ncbi:MAG: PAS domain S-box protein [Deltaproteobacteria bacterium]
MAGKGQTKAQLLEELKALRLRVEELEERERHRKKMEIDLGDNGNSLRTLVENINDVLYTLDPDGIITYISPAIKPILEYDPSELIGRSLWDFVYEEDLVLAKDQFQKIISSGRLILREYRLLERSGKIRWLRTLGKPSYKDDEVVGLRGVATDVTKRKWAEERLHLLSQAVEQSSEGIALSDLEGNVLFVNKAFADLHGYEVEEIIGKHFSIFHTSEQMPSVEEAIRQVREMGKFIGESWHARRDGTVFPGLMHNSLLRGSRGRPIGVMAMLRDITDLKKAEDKLRENQAELERRVKERTADLMKAKEDLTSELKRRKETMDHLLVYQSRLRSLASELTLTEERERRQIAAYLHDNIGHALAMARIKLDSLRSLVSPGDAGVCLDDATDMIKAAIQEVRSLTFELSTPVIHELGFEEAVDWLVEQFHKVNGISCTVAIEGQAKPLADETSIFLFHSVRELLVNVAKHARARSAKISISREHDHIVIRVEDDGVGFNPSKTDSYLQENGGFGLFSIRERFESIGGTMAIESQPGRGCCVILSAPLSNGGVAL